MSEVVKSGEGIEDPLEGSVSLDEIEAELEENGPTFDERVNHILTMIQENPAVRDRLMVEMYIFLNDMDTMMRTLAQAGGPMQMMKMLMGKGGN